MLHLLRKTVHPAATFLLVLLTFGFLAIYSTFDSIGFSVRRLRPAGRLKSKYELQEEIDLDVDIFDGVDLEFLPNFKNPCWYNRLDGRQHKRPNLFASRLKPNSKVLLENYRNQQKRSYELRCLPYFFLIGQPKCATTDVFQRINLHPEVAETLIKGPHWWTRRRYGQPFSPRPLTFSEYLDLFSSVSSQIESNWENSTLSDAPYHQMITGDGSTSTLWDSSYMMNCIYSSLSNSSREKLIQLFFAKREGINHEVKHRGLSSLLGRDKEEDVKSYNEGCCFSSQASKDDYRSYERTAYVQDFRIQPGAVLPITVADLIHSVLPRSRIIAVIREPASRLFSSYAFFTKRKKLSPQNFDSDVRNSIMKWTVCVSQYSERTCAYNKTLQNSMEVRLYNGMYNIFLRDWLNVFPEEQILVLRMEDYHQDVTASMASIYAHLGLRGLTEEEEKLVDSAPIHNKSRKKQSIGMMLNSTVEILRKFYGTFNNDLADLLGDSRFTWQDYYSQV